MNWKKWNVNKIPKSNFKREVTKNTKYDKDKGTPYTEKKKREKIKVKNALQQFLDSILM